MDLVDFPTEDNEEGRNKESQKAQGKGLEMMEEGEASSSTPASVTDVEESQSDQSLYSRIWTYFGSNPKPS